MRYLPDLMLSLEKQTFTEFSVLVIDNASADGSVDFLREKYPQVKIIRNFRNLGFSAAHNQGIKYAMAMWKDEPMDSNYVLITNPDIILTPDYLEKLVAAADTHPEAASFSGKLLGATRAEDDGFKDDTKTNTIDSTGLSISRSRRVTDRGAGELDSGQFDQSQEVFGVSGALALYRLSALDAVRHGEEFFDDDFFAYKEDADLAWRLQLAGFFARFVPEALAYHFRRVGGKEKSGFFQMFKNRKYKPKEINYYSYRNHLWMLVKNDGLGNFFQHLPWIGGF